MNKDGVLEELCSYLGPKEGKTQRKSSGAQSIQ